MSRCSTLGHVPVPKIPTTQEKPTLESKTNSADRGPVGVSGYGVRWCKDFCLSVARVQRHSFVYSLSGVESSEALTCLQHDFHCVQEALPVGSHIGACSIS